MVDNTDPRFGGNPNVNAIVDNVAKAETAVMTAPAGTFPKWTAPIISVLTLVIFGCVLGFAHYTGSSTASELDATAAAMALTVVNFWIGSSAGSAQKNALLAASIPAISK